MDFGWALDQMKKGNSVTRKSFKDRCVIHIQKPIPNALNTLPYLPTVTVKPLDLSMGI